MFRGLLLYTVGALESPDLLLSYPMTTISSHNTIILIITSPSSIFHLPTIPLIYNRQVCNAWIKSIANPIEIAHRFGLGCVERSAALVFPPQLFVKSVVCAKEMIRMLHSNSSRARETGASMCVLPAFLDSDIMMPLLLIRYYCFLHSGFAWNHVVVTDMLGDASSGDADANVLREVVYLLVLSQQPQPSSTCNSQSTDLTETILQLFTGQIFSSDGTGSGGGGESGNGKSGGAGGAGGNSIFPSEGEAEHRVAAKVDKILYSLLGARDSIASIPAVTQEGASICLRYYRKLIQMSHWKIGKTECSAEVGEMFNMLSLLYGLAKAVVYAYMQRERLMLSVGGQANTEYLTFSALLGSLAPGMLLLLLLLL